MKLQLIAALLLISSIGCQDTNKRLAILPSFPEKEIYLGKIYAVTCEGEDFSDEEKKLLELKWFRDDQEITEVSKNPQLYVVKSVGSSVLYLDGITADLAGTYVCKGTYAGNIDLEISQTMYVLKAITWVDCLETQELILGQSGFIQCTVEANPPAAVDWQDGKKQSIATNDKYSLSNSGLSIKNVSFEDSGLYKIIAKVRMTGAVEDKRINVQVKVPPTIVEPPEDTVAVEGKEARMKCVANGDPKPNIRWFNQDRSDLKDFPDDYLVDQNTGELVIKSVRKDQGGRYICEADNVAGNVEAEAMLTVIIMPKIEKFENLTVNTNGIAEFDCYSSGDPTPKITIAKVGNHDIPDKSRIKQQTLPAENGWTLHKISIRNVSRTDDGLYTCHSENQGGQNEKTGHLTVQFRPEMYETRKEYVTWESNAVNLSCIANSIPNATIKWWHRGQEIKSGELGFKIFGIGPTSNLYVEEPREGRYGLYECRASNPIGDNKAMIELKEVYKPGMVTGTTVGILTATTITFRVMEPDETGGAPITGYICQYRLFGTDEEWITKVWPAGSENYILDNLTPLKQYEVQFAAQNIVGSGPFHLVDPITMPEISVPEAPEIIRKPGTEISYGRQPSSFKVSWIIPADNGAVIKNFEINYYKVLNGTGKWEKSTAFKTQKVKVDHSRKNSFEIKNLSPQTHYRVEIRARNDIGYSPYSELIFKTAKGNGTRQVGELSSANEKVNPLSAGAIVGIMLGILVIVLIVLDVSFCLTKKCGVSLFMWTKFKGGDKTDEKCNKEFIEDGKPGEKEPLQNGDNIPDVKHNDDDLLKGEKAKENDGMDVNTMDADIKPAKDSAV